MTAERKGTASCFEKVPLELLPGIIDSIDGIPLRYDDTTSDRKGPNNFFGGVEWVLDKEKLISDYELETALNILRSVLELHLPGHGVHVQLGKKLMGVKIDKVSIHMTIMCMKINVTIMGFPRPLLRGSCTTCQWGNEVIM